VSTISDAAFIFSLDKLKEYVTSAGLHAIAITNHDMFDLGQFYEIVEHLDCTVFPGIEINIDKGHLLLISENGNLDDFQRKANAIHERVMADGAVSVGQLSEIFGDLSNYLLIPHYGKRPAILGETLDQLRNYICAGEVDSPKKFIRMAKDDTELTPVIFSDVRIKDDLHKFPSRQTYIDCGDLTLGALKNTFRDRSKVSLSKSAGNSLFQVFDDGQMLSTGLNILLGPRSSGKTVMLGQINDECDNVKYIEQFSLVQLEDAAYEKEFKNDVARKKSVFAEKHLSPFKSALDDVLTVNRSLNGKKVEEYLSSLMKSAEEAGKKDAFSKVSLFNSTQFDVSEDKVLGSLIGSVQQLIENIEYREIIDKHVEVDDLKALACELIELLRANDLERRVKGAVNDIIREVNGKLQRRTSAAPIKDVDIYKVLIEGEKISKFKEIVKLVQTERIIKEEGFQGFKVVCKQRAFGGAGEIKKVSGKQVGFSEAFKEYDSPYKYLLALQYNEALTESEFYKYFTCIEYEILNKDGFKVSGGERSEFRLLQEIKGAKNFDYLLIDEPESSFDNLFLKGEVNQMLKEISQTMPVVVVTHNSTVGASINADYIVYTSKEHEGDDIIYRRYSGYPSDKELRSIDERTIDNFRITIDSLEAGEEAYEARKGCYESIKN
jgi:ABC-type phosphate transport system ATPase subunit